MKKLLCLSALALSLTASILTAPILAHASPGDNPQRRLQYVDMGGNLHEMEITDDAKIKMFIAHSQALKPGTLVMTLDGHIYILQDAKLPDGQMMSDVLTH